MRKISAMIEWRSGPDGPSDLISAPMSYGYDLMSRESNPGPWSYEATVLTTVPPCRPIYRGMVWGRKKRLRRPVYKEAVGVVGGDREREDKSS